MLHTHEVFFRYSLSKEVNIRSDTSTYVQKAHHLPNIFLLTKYILIYLSWIGGWIDRQTERQTDRDRQTETDRQTDRQRQTGRDRQTETDRQRQTDRDRQTETDR